MVVLHMLIAQLHLHIVLLSWPVVLVVVFSYLILYNILWNIHFHYIWAASQ